ncbi:MAG TPA: M28 family peptidase [Bryobacteraceae bacterium]|nr:M28 family peptidase [Bryobacteraceae bacterium]
MRIWKMSIGIGVLAVLATAVGVLMAQNSQLSGSRIKAHVRFLSSDLLEGRGVGSRGGQLTEEYIAAQLAAIGARPAGEKGTYFQTVPMVGVQTLPESQLAFEKGGKRVWPKWQDEFVGGTHRQQENVSFDGEAIFVGHGIANAQEKWDDYKGVDVKGKVVVVFTNEPQPENPEVFKGKTLTYAGRWVYKFEEAARRGALGCLIIHTTPTAGYGWEVVRNSWSKEDPQMRLEPNATPLAFAGWVTQNAGEKILAMAGHTVNDLLRAADSRDFKPIPLGIAMRGNLKAKIRAIESRNVLGMIPGSDPKLRDQYVLYSAHWDHLGVALPVNGDAIYNGAIDNATGVGVVLETARAFASLRDAPRRSLLFAFWTAEESGLRGAEYYSHHPLAPAAKTAVNINYDALFPSARTRDIVVSAAERTSMWAMVQATAKRYQLEIAPDPRPEQGSYYRSDHFMMARIGVPAFRVGLGSRIHGKPDNFADTEFAEYNAKRYHQPSDEFRDEWDFASLEHAARFGFTLGLNAANQESMPRWNAGDEFAVTPR